MKPISEIVNLPEYKQHIFTGACSRFDCGERQLPSIYWNGFSEKLILYRLRNCKTIDSRDDEISIANIPTYIETLESQYAERNDHLNDIIKERLMTIYETMTKIAAEYGVDLKESLDTKVRLTAYGADAWSDLWQNEEFATQYRKDSAELAKRIEPMQELANLL